MERFSYDPWGKRRQATTSPRLAILPGSHLIPASLANLTRGFTGHEHLDRVGLIHMNGRIYDPELGRFLSADPILQFPASTQGLDRYAYVLNNPVSLSDPSGHLVFGLAAALIGVKLAASGKFVLAALTAAIGGYLDTGLLKAGIFSAISAGFSFGVGAIGEVLKASFSSAFQLAAVAVLHGLTQGILAAAQGGKFGAGFLSAAASSAFGPKGSGAGLSDAKRLVRIVQAAAIGGTASRIGGGKFANGAVTGAFVQAFNDQLHGGGDEYVSGSLKGDLSAYEAEELFYAARWAAELAGQDASGIVFDNRIAVATGEGKGPENYGFFDNARDARRAASQKGARGVVGGFHADDGSITIYRNAFMTKIDSIQIAPIGRNAWRRVSIRPGFASGLFQIGHEIGHRHVQGEFGANVYGHQVLDSYCSRFKGC